MLRRTMVVAMAVGVMAMMGPGGASGNWEHHNTPIANNVTLGLTGNTRFQGGLGGVECQVTSRIKLLAQQTTGTVETYVPHPTSETANCKGLGGLAFCQTHEMVPQAPNWTMHPAEGEKLRTTQGDVSATLTGGFCPIKYGVLTAGNVIATPNQPNTVTSLQLSGTMQLDLQTTNGTVDKESVTIGGTLTIESPNAGTYSL